MRILLVLLFLAGTAFAGDEIVPIDKDNLKIVTTTERVVSREDLLDRKKILEEEIARNQARLAEVNALLAQLSK